MEEFKIGDKVRLVRLDRELEYYKKFLGKSFTIKAIERDSSSKFAELEEERNLMPYLENLELVKEGYSYKDLKKSPIGTKITFEDGKVFFRIKEKEGIDTFTDDTNRIVYDLKTFKDNWSDGVHGKIIKIEEPEYKTVYKTKTEPEILDKAEKRYLRGIIMPFKDKVICIRKSRNLMESLEYISIELKGDSSICLPYFEPNTMYKGMKLDKKYTLKELGL